MNEKLQQAIAAARNGQSTEAQLLLTQILQADPSETEAWFLLSNLVESEQKKAAYLGKVLALNPEHEMARQMLARVQGKSEAVGEERLVEETAVPPEPLPPQQTEPEPAPPAPPVIAAEPPPDTDQAKDDTIPAWLAEEEAQWEQLEPVQIETEPEEVAGIPDWLQDQADKPEAEETAVDEPTPSPPQQPEIKPLEITPEPSAISDEARQKQQTTLTRILYALITAAGIIFLIILYLMATAL